MQLLGHMSNWQPRLLRFSIGFTVDRLEARADGSLCKHTKNFELMRLVISTVKSMISMHNRHWMLDLMHVPQRLHNDPLDGTKILFHLEFCRVSLVLPSLGLGISPNVAPKILQIKCPAPHHGKGLEDVRMTGNPPTVDQQAVSLPFRWDLC